MSSTPNSRGPFARFGAALIENGYQIVPIPLGTKGPRLPDWRNSYPKTVADHAAMLDAHASDGVGIIAKNTPAVDIDSTYEPIVDAMVQWTLDNLGDAPVRVGKAPKALLVYATSTPFAKVTSSEWLAPNGSKHRLEVLGDGQQFVAWHKHPETLKPYAWTSDDDLLSLSVLDLEEITHEHAVAAAREFDRLCAEYGFTKVSKAKEAVTNDADFWGEEMPPEETDSEIARVRAALFGASDDNRFIDPDGSRDTYLTVLAALKWTRWLSAEAIAREWAEGSDDKFDEHDFKRDWKSLVPTKNGRTTTLASIYGIAKEAGWDASRAPTEEQKTEAVEALLEQIAGLSEKSSRADRRAVIKAIADAQIDKLDLAELTKEFCKATKIAIRDARAAIAEAKAIEHEEPTHGNYAKKLLQELEDRTGVTPVGCEGSMWTYDPAEGVWSGKDPNDYEVDVQRLFDGQDNCNRRNDYIAIANHAFAIASIGKEKFFEEAPVGLACDGRFYSLDGGVINREKLSSSHRQRVLANVVPKVMPTPKWDSLMAAAFDGDQNREQELLLEEFFGAAILGFGARYEKALFMYGKGRAGKGTIMKVISSILPVNTQSAVPPDRWDREYYMADLAAKRLNVVGEVSDERPIDGATFKGVLGRDSLMARQPNHRTFMFTNTAAHAFNGNYFPASKDHGAEFFSRWILMEFRNSLIGREGLINTNLAREIITEELPGVTARLLQGAKRLLERGHFEMTPQHHRLMAKWQHRSSSAVEFIGDSEVCVLGDFPQIETNRLMVFQAYVVWCRESNRRAMGKHKFYEEFEKAGISSMGVRFAVKTGGTVLVRGMALRSQLFESEVWQGSDEI